MYESMKRPQSCCGMTSYRKLKVRLTISIVSLVQAYSRVFRLAVVRVHTS